MYKAIIFDMDGTILNTIEDIADSVNYTMREMNMPTHSIMEVRDYVGNGLHKTIERAVPTGTSDDDIEKAFEILIAHYKKNCNNKTRPYDGIVETIREIRKRGYKTAVISNKKDDLVKQLCEEVFNDCFDYSLGALPGVANKPDRAMVDITLDALGVTAEECIYVGDSEVDIMTAKNSSLKNISVTWGLRDKELLIKNGADIFVNKPEEILELLN